MKEPVGWRSDRLWKFCAVEAAAGVIIVKLNSLLVEKAWAF